MDMLERRKFLKGTGFAAAALTTVPLHAAEAVGAATGPMPLNTDTVPGTAVQKRAPLAPIKASMDRMISLKACLRPFRAQGPRTEAERMGRKTVIHNYGHGGSGWSLSWGSGRRAVALAKETGEKNIAIIGCGAIGLTTAVVAQRAGLKVRIYTKDQIPYVRSFHATGVWSPAARIVTAEHATPEFRKMWEEMARYSYYQYSAMLGLPGNPIEWIENYKLSDTPFKTGEAIYTHSFYRGEPEYPWLEQDHTPDLLSQMQVLTKDQHPFPVEHVGRVNQMMFNIPAYAQMLMDSFFAAGGELVIREFEDPRQFLELPEKTIIHSTGYAARALLGDNSLIPVRGQSARFIPQPEVNYGISYEAQNVYAVPRRDGMLIQEYVPGDYGNENEVTYLDGTQKSVEKIARLCANMGKSA